MGLRRILASHSSLTPFGHLHHTVGASAGNGGEDLWNYILFMMTASTKVSTDNCFGGFKFVVSRVLRDPRNVRRRSTVVLSTSRVYARPSGPHRREYAGLVRQAGPTCCFNLVGVTTGHL
jgi:hypothetical protein